MHVMALMSPTYLYLLLVLREKTLDALCMNNINFMHRSLAAFIALVTQQMGGSLVGVQKGQLSYNEHNRWVLMDMHLCSLSSLCAM